ncbi:hypothetical protein [Yoonia sp.]|uniref:hypothetical protein n=1 Tax=Yoonia sp. TaxID=2212373 RepID=UPI002DF85F36|nr:hypothetical protein [Yoonia sp.]
MKIRIADFKGEIPRRHPRLLPMEYAQLAQNTRLDDGSIAPVREAALTTTLNADAASIFLHKGVWFSFPNDVDVVPGPVADDRLYITGNGAPSMNVNGTNYPLALNAPVLAPTVVMSGEPDDTIAQFITYAYTFVTIFDEESAPSPVSNAILWSAGLNVTVSDFSPPQSGRGINRIRIYRSQTSASGITDLYFVSEQPIATTSYVHDLVEEPLQEVLPSADYDAPPSTMAGLISLPNGMMAAFDGKKVLFCEPFKPHAWPEKYRLTIDRDVVGLAGFGTTLAILTTATPYVAQGTAPENMIMEKMERDLPCVAKRGIVDMGYAAVYPSSEGLVMITGGSADLVSRNLFTTEQWKALSPSSFHAEQYEGRYFFTHTPAGDSVQKMGIFDITGAQPYYIETDEAPITMTRDASTGALYMLLTARNVHRWDAPGAELKPQTWRSRLFQLVSPVSYSGVLVEADDPIGAIPAGETPNLTRIYADGVLVREFNTLNAPVRMPSGFQSRKWQIEIIGYVPITGISMAQSYDELGVP